MKYVYSEPRTGTAMGMMIVLPNFLLVTAAASSALSAFLSVSLPTLQPLQKAFTSSDDPMALRIPI